jgi:hypothetical protein
MGAYELIKRLCESKSLSAKDKQTADKILSWLDSAFCPLVPEEELEE